MTATVPYAGPDEFPIAEIPDTPWWSENFAAMFSAPAERAAVFYSIGRWHSDPSVWRELIMVSLPDGRMLYSRGFARNGTASGPGSALSTYTIVQPGRTVQLTFDGPVSESSLDDMIEHGARSETTQRCTIDLRFEAAAPLWNMKGDSAEASTMAGAIHIDHIGSVNGSVSHDGRTYAFDNGYSVRDHSRGPREVSQYANHNWISGSFPGGRAFYVYAMRGQGSETIGMSNAVVTQDGELFPAELVHTELLTTLNDVAREHKIVLRSELGDMEIEVVEVLNTFVSSMLAPYDTVPGATLHRRAAQLTDQSVRMRWNGTASYGWVERGFAPYPLM